MSPQLDVVIGYCCDFLVSWLDESNVLEVHHLADVYGLKQLNARVHSYILRNIQTFSRTEGYRRLPQDEVFRVLSSNELQVSRWSYFEGQQEISWFLKVEAFVLCFLCSDRKLDFFKLQTWSSTFFTSF